MRIIQVVDALDYGDGVGTDVLNIRKFLLKMGYDTEIYSRFAHPALLNITNPIENLKIKENDILLYHYAGSSACLNRILELQTTKVLVFHNLTPPKYFKKYNMGIYNDIVRAQDELRETVDHFDAYIADSSYNKEYLVQLGVSDERVDVLPILFDFCDLTKQYDEMLLGRLLDVPVFLCVGRIAPNKKTEDVLSAFDYYWKNIDQNAMLIFVGNTAQSPKYFEMLQKKLSRMKSRHNVIFSGKVTNVYRQTFYKAADVLLSMSDHEGFCMPLLEAMKFRIPVVAFDAGAQAETMGRGGVVLKEKDPEKIAYVLAVIMKNSKIREEIIQHQIQRLEDFSEWKMMDRLKATIKKLECLA